MDLEYFRERVASREVGLKKDGFDARVEVSRELDSLSLARDCSERSMVKA